MDDLISRQAAIDKLKREEKIFYSPTGLRYLIGAIRDLPSAQPERKNGEWQKVDEQPYFRKHFHKVCCSVCRKQGYDYWNFCPNCGADMRNSKLQYGDEDTLQGGLMSAT